MNRIKAPGAPSRFIEFTMEKDGYLPEGHGDP
jgi:hypothetical protein